MSKLLFTVRSILSQLSNLVTKMIKPALILGPVLFCLTAAAAPVKIAVIDTGFCTETFKKSFILPALDLTDSVKLDCKKPDWNSPRFHGQKVLKEFLATLNPKIQVELYPLIIFNEKGDQKKEYWLKAIDWVKNKKMDLVLTAAGMITTEAELNKLPKELPGIWFVPSGRIGPGINEKTVLFPQHLAGISTLFLIGDYYDGKVVLYDNGLLYKDKIDFYFPSGSGAFTGTSRAVAEASAKALNLCGLKDLRECLVKRSRDYFDSMAGKKIRTY